MSNALLAMIAKKKAQASRTKTASVPAGRSRWKIYPSWRIVKTAPAGIEPTKWVAATLAAISSGNAEAQMKIATAAINCPPGFKPIDKLEWMLQFYADFGQHFIKDASNKVVAVHVCNQKTFGRPCGICDSLNSAIMQTTDDVQKRRLEEAKSNGRIVLNATRLDGPTPTVVELLEVPYSVLHGNKGAGGLLSLFPDWPRILELKDGADIIIDKQGTGKQNTTYNVTALNPTAASNFGLEQLAGLHDIDAFVMQGTAEGEQRALAGVSAITGLLPNSRPTLSQFANSAAAQQFDDIPEFPPAGAPVAQPVQQTVAVDPLAALGADLAGLATAAPAVTQTAQPVQQVAQPQPTAPAAVAGANALDDILKGL